MVLLLILTLSYKYGIINIIGKPEVIIMKKKIIIIISLIILIIVIVTAGLMFKNYLSSNMFDEGSLKVKSREEQLAETKQNIYKNITDENERIEFINTMVANEMFTQEEANFLLSED